MKNKVVISLSWLMVFLVMLMIFSFSAENSEVSSETSEGVVVQILGVVMDKEEITPPVIRKFQFPIRKVAHFCIYMLLGFSMLSAFDKTFKIQKWLNYLLSSVSCILYAVSDEIHQGFSAGRGPRVFDVFLDSCGAISGIIIYIAFMKIFEKMTKKIG